jgi:hypothetical protein
MDVLEIQLPEEVQNLTEGSLFDNDGLISDNMLSKYLAYNPELIRIYGLAMADLKKKKREMEFDIYALEKDQEKVRARTILKIDPSVYKNESMREAKVLEGEEYIDIEKKIMTLKKDLIELDYEIDQLSESYWKHKGMQQSLDAMTKLRLAERKY